MMKFDICCKKCKTKVDVTDIGLFKDKNYYRCPICEERLEEDNFTVLKNICGWSQSLTEWTNKDDSKFIINLKSDEQDKREND